MKYYFFQSIFVIIFCFNLSLGINIKIKETIICEKLKIVNNKNAIPMYFDLKNNELFFTKQLLLIIKDNINYGLQYIPNQNNIQIKIDGRSTKFEIKKKSTGIYILKLVVRSVAIKDKKINTVEIKYIDDTCEGTMNLIQTHKHINMKTIHDNHLKLSHKNYTFLRLNFIDDEKIDSKFIISWIHIDEEFNIKNDQIKLNIYCTNNDVPSYTINEKNMNLDTHKDSYVFQLEKCKNVTLTEILRTITDKDKKNKIVSLDDQMKCLFIDRNLIHSHRCKKISDNLSFKFSFIKKSASTSGSTTKNLFSIEEHILEEIIEVDKSFKKRGSKEEIKNMDTITIEDYIYFHIFFFIVIFFGLFWTFFRMLYR